MRGVEGLRQMAGRMEFASFIHSVIGFGRYTPPFVLTPLDKALNKVMYSHRPLRTYLCLRWMNFLARIYVWLEDRE